jgi:hypothetical protein
LIGVADSKEMTLQKIHEKNPLRLKVACHLIVQTSSAHMMAEEVFFFIPKQDEELVLSIHH